MTKEAKGEFLIVYGGFCNPLMRGNGMRSSNMGQVLAVTSRDQPRADRLDFVISSMTYERCAGMPKQIVEYRRSL